MEFGEGVHRWWCQYHLLDERSLAAMRIGLSFVLFWDLTRGWLMTGWPCRPSIAGHCPWDRIIRQQVCGVHWSCSQVPQRR